MDPVTHSLTGAALSRAGLHRATPLATVALVIGANAPDLDVLTYVNGSYGALAARRGITHGPLALLLLPIVVAAGILLYDRFWRRRRRPHEVPARAVPLLGLAFIGVLTHSPLDWLNTYGIRLLMPFTDRWFYGDALFIIDPWIWLALAAPLVPAARSPRGRRLWVLLGVVATMLVMAAPGVPLGARALWVVLAGGLAAATTLAWRGPERAVPSAAARAALLLAAVYIGGMIGSDLAARRHTEGAVLAEGLAATRIMVAPVAANPLVADIVVETADAYHLGSFDWLARPRAQLEGRRIPKGERTAEVLAALQLQEVRDYLRWSRFPYVEVLEDDVGRYVRFGDARYPSRMRGGLSGVTVRIEGTARAQP